MVIFGLFFGLIGGYVILRALAAVPTVLTPNATVAHTVDGQLSETDWKIATPVNKAVIGSSNDKVTFGTVWDKNYLYVGVKIQDASLKKDSVNAWDDDSVEIYIDPEANGGKAYDAKDRQFNQRYNDTMLREIRGNTTGVLHAWAPTSDGFSVELAIPWSNLGVKPTANMNLGFDVGYNDDDNGGSRDSQTMWNGTIDNWHDPSGFGRLQLTSNVGIMTKSVGTQPVIDGKLNEAEWSLDSSINKSAIGSPNNTATFGTLWDSKYFYVGVKVLDSSLQNGSAYIWNNDSVEVYLDPNLDRGTGYDNLDKQLTKGWNDSALGGLNASTPGVLHAWAPITGGYSVEFAIPWSSLGVTPSVGMNMGFDVGYNDSDSNGTRTSQVMWNGTVDNWHDPSGFGRLSLIAGLPAPPPPPPPPPPVGNKLTWAPPVLSNPTTCSIPDTGLPCSALPGQNPNQLESIYLDQTKDYILKLGRRQGPLSISGGHNIVIIGGEITPGEPTTQADPGPGRPFSLYDWTGTFHIEGVHVNGAGDCAFCLQSVHGILQLENIRVDNVHAYRDDSSIVHADVIQVWEGPDEVRMDRFTAASSWQGFLWSHGLSPTAPYTARVNQKNVNLKALSPQPNSILTWPDGTKKDKEDLGPATWHLSSGTTFSCQECWVATGWYAQNYQRKLQDSIGGWDNNNGTYTTPTYEIHGFDGQVLYNQPGSSSNDLGRRQGDYMVWPSVPSLQNEKWSFGVPLGGDFVPSNLAGPSYVSPGY